MSISSDGILAYGYDLGEAYDLEIPEEYENDKGSYFERTFLHAFTGFTEKRDREDKTYFDRKHEAESRIPIEIVYHCSYDYPMYIIAIKNSVKRAWRGSPVVIQSLETKSEWNNALHDALVALGIEVTGEPQWFLASIMG